MHVSDLASYPPLTVKYPKGRDGVIIGLLFPVRSSSELWCGKKYAFSFFLNCVSIRFLRVMGAEFWK